MNASAVLFDEITTASGLKAGVACLNSPQTLNGLSLEMCELLTEQFTQWAKDPAIGLVILRGAGDKAFSAGGDLHGLYKGMLENTSGNAWNNVHARTFFDIEYRLDYLIHTFPKPLLCWGNGIVMGGGVGLMMGASHRVVTETTRFAMPEISIGLFPDVGGTWMLSRLPGGIGTFLALTGAQLGASDCQLLGLSDYVVDSDAYNTLIEQITKSHWTTCRTTNHARLRQVLLQLKPQASVPKGPLEKYFSEIRQACDGNDFNAIVANLTAWAGHEDTWLSRAAKTFLAGSPGSARLSLTLLQRVRLMALADVFREEYIVSLNCGIQGDFQEGIRALLIDKDKSPRWNPARYDQATHDWVQCFFKTPWPANQPHPLADLGNA